MDPYKIQPSLPAKNFNISTSKTPPTPLATLLEEISSSETDVLRAFSPYGQNTTDPVVRAKGLKIYKEMGDDDQVKVCLDVRKHARLSSTWNIIPGKEGDAKSEMYAEFIKHILDRMEGTFEDVLYEIYSAIDYGFSLSELNFILLEDGPFKGKIGLRSIKTREPFNYYFKTDVFGNILGLVYIGLHANISAINRESKETSPLGLGLNTLSATNRASFLSSPTGEEWGSLKNPFPIDKFVIYSYNAQFGNPYGRSDLLSAFRSWTSKKMVMRFWNIWLERYASPFVWATYDPALGLRREVMAELDDFLKNLSSRSGWRGPKGVELNFAQSGTGKAAGDAYKDAIESHNRYISHAILFPNLLGFTGDQGSGGSGGSYGLGKTHMDAFMWVLEKMARDTSESIVGEQIITRLINLNFPGVDDTLMPKFKFEGVDENSIQVRANIIKTLGDGGFIDVNEEWIREFLTLPKKDDGVILKKPVQGGFGFPDKNKDGDQEQTRSEPPDNKSKEMTAPEDKTKAFKMRQMSTFEEKLQVKQFETKINKLQDMFFSALSEEVLAIRDKLLKDVERKKIIESDSPKEVNSLTANVGGFKNTLQEWLVKIYLDSKLNSFEELGRGGVKIQVTKKFSEDAAPMYPWSPLPPQEAVDFFNRKVTAYIFDDNGRKTLIDIATRAEMEYYTTRAFTIAGVVRDDILNDAKQILLNGIKRQDIPGTMGDLKSMFNKYLDQGIAVDGELLNPARLNTIVRTNMVEAINEGRRNMFADPDVKGFVEYWQYSAILDDRTTDYCACMDQKIFRIEDMATLNPPAHYNCRALAIPVTKYEVEDAKNSGSGIEISEPCLDRMTAFKDIKRDPINIPTKEPSNPQTDKIPTVVPVKETPVLDTTAPAPKSAGTISAEESLKQELAMIISHCPYSVCHSNKIRLVSQKLNVGEFNCDGCGLPFRVSSKGDLYLYDAGVDKWERATVGLMPTYFAEKLKILKDRHA